MFIKWGNVDQIFRRGEVKIKGNRGRDDKNEGRLCP